MSININEYEKQFEKDYNNDDFEVILTKYRKKRMVEILDRYPTNRMLEIGCGMEPFFLTYNDFEKMTIVEPADIMYNRALEYAGKDGRDITCVHGFLENKVEELKNNQFDFVLLMGLIHEVENPDELVRATRQICSEDTYVIISTSNPKSFHLTLAYEAGIIPALGLITERAKSFQRHSTFTMEELKQLVEKHNFEVVEEGSYFIKPFSHNQMKALISNNIIGPEVLDGLDKMVKYMPDLGAEIYLVLKPV